MRGFISWVRTLLFLAALGALLWNANQTRIIPLDQPKRAAPAADDNLINIIPLTQPKRVATPADDNPPHIFWLDQPQRAASAANHDKHPLGPVVPNYP